MNAIVDMQREREQVLKERNIRYSAALEAMDPLRIVRLQKPLKLEEVIERRLYDARW